MKLVLKEVRGIEVISKAISRLGISITRAIQIGSSPVHIPVINWSKRNRGSVARNHTNRKAKKHVLIARITDCRLMYVSFTNSSGKWYPPKNRIAVSVDISTIEQYSARKNITKIIELCSVKNPARVIILLS